MFRIGILGSENSHAMAFSKMLNGIDKNYEGEFDDMCVVGTFGTDDASNKALIEQAGVQFIADKPEDLLGHVDAVMVTARDGKYHAEYARPFIEAGLPAFIDKPFTRDSAEALALVKLAKEKKIPLCGGSSLKVCMETERLASYAAKNRDAILTGSVYAPVNMVNEYGDFWFYADHLAEISLAVFGWDPKWVEAVGRNDKGVTALVGYENYNISNHFCEGMYQYGGTVVTKGGIHTQTIGLDDAYPNECRVFARMLRTGKMHGTYEQLVQPVYYMEALFRSMQTGEKVEVAKAVVD
ncbi:MAG: Gfo/Idh/MocA family oxidoreductase [Clostridia bacterium]|nr:Gfo/Idh/MocA family oxidoreductase [Clostridia bacterium]